MTKIVKEIGIVFIGALLALIAFEFLMGRGKGAHSALGKLFGGVEKYGTFSPGAIARANDPSDSMYEFPLQSNNGRRPARVNNRTLQNAVYPSSGAPSMLPSAPTSVTRPGKPDVTAAYDESIWSGITPGDMSSNLALLDDLLPSATASPVATLDSYASQFAGRASRVPIDS